MVKKSVTPKGVSRSISKKMLTKGKKKIVKKTSGVKIKTVKKLVKRKIVKKAIPMQARVTKRKLSLVWKNLVFFLVLTVLSLVLYSASSSEILIDVFMLLIIIFGFVSLAFLLVLLILVFLRILNK